MEITKDMTIGDVVGRYPEAAAVMMGYGLHCVGCGANPYETIENGCLGHGMDEVTINKLVEELNEHAKAALKSKKENDGKTVFLSEIAAGKLNEFMNEEKKGNSGVRLSVNISDEGLMQFGLEFAQQPKINEETFVDRGIKIFVERDVVNMVKGTEIDYVDNDNGSGFKINTPTIEEGGCGPGCGCH